MEEFKNVNESTSQVREHHDFSESVQINLHEDVKSLLSILEVVVNPFEDDSNDLFDLETKIIISETVAQSLYMGLKMAEINNFETLLETVSAIIQIPSVKTSFPCSRLLALILLQR